MTPVPATPARSPSAPLPDWSRLLVLLDYDGTITTRECNEVALRRFTGDAWWPFEEASRRGELSHAACFSRQLGLITAPRREVLATMVDAAEPRPGFAGFAGAVTAAGGRVVVVSAGVREAIEEVWRRFALPPVELHASELIGTGPKGGPPYRVEFDWRLGDCPRCGPDSCKGGLARELRGPGDAVVVFGDGVSDLCMAREAGLVFARDTLARLCVEEGIAFTPFDDFTGAREQVATWMRARG
jgi:2-hydroxy-3-keto-5-methylthiopentenyl-1-phosphate phosphatase